MSINHQMVISLAVIRLRKHKSLDRLLHFV